MDKIVSGVYTGLLASLVGNDVMMNVFEEGDNNILFNALYKAGIDPKKFGCINNFVNYLREISNKKPDAEIPLGDIEKGMIDLCVSSSQLERMMASGYLYFNPDTFGEKYTGLEDVLTYYNKKLKELRLLEIEKAKKR